VQRVGERLLHVDVLAGPDCRHRGHGVDVVGRADHHRVDVPGLLVEQLAKILVSACAGERSVGTGVCCPTTVLGLSRAVGVA
jgi:hypothetical protein